MVGRSHKKILVAGLIAAIQILVAAVYFVPFYSMIVQSFKSSIFTSFPPDLSPKIETLNNYLCVWTFGMQPVPPQCELGHSGVALPTKSPPLFPMWYMNSIIIAVSITAGSVFFGALAGYALARLRFRGRIIFYYMILVTFMIPFPVITIAEYVLMTEIHWIDTYQAVIVPGIASSLSIFLMRQYYTTLPTEIEDSAKIDGLRPHQIFFRIALPLSKPALSAAAIYSFIGAWNALIWPLYALQSVQKFTLPVATAFFKGANGTQIIWGQMMAFDVLAALPTLVIFIIFERYFIGGIALEGGGGKQ